MSKATTNTVSAGFPIASILTIIFVIAKLTGHFSYSWWIVFSPMLISSGIGLLIIGVLFVVLLIGLIVAVVQDKATNRKFAK